MKKIDIDSILNDEEFYIKLAKYKRENKLDNDSNDLENNLNELENLNKEDVNSCSNDSINKQNDNIKQELLKNKYQNSIKEINLKHNSNKCCLDVLHIFVLAIKVIYITVNFYNIIYDKANNFNDIILSIIKNIFIFAFVIFTYFDSYDIVKIYNNVYIYKPKYFDNIRDEYTLKMLLEFEERDKFMKIKKIYYNNLSNIILWSSCWIIAVRSRSINKINASFLTYILSFIIFISVTMLLFLHQFKIMSDLHWKFRNKYFIFLVDPHTFIKVLNEHQNIPIVNAFIVNNIEKYKDCVNYESINYGSVNNDIIINNKLFIDDTNNTSDNVKLDEIDIVDEFSINTTQKKYNTPYINDYEKAINKLKFIIIINYILLISALTSTVIIYNHKLFLIPISLLFINLFISHNHLILSKINILIIQSIVMILLITKL